MCIVDSGDIARWMSEWASNVIYVDCGGYDGEINSASNSVCTVCGGHNSRTCLARVKDINRSLVSVQAKAGTRSTLD